MSMIEYDFCGLACPLPLLKTKQLLHKLDANEKIVVLADDPGSVQDIPKYIEHSKHQLIELKEQAGIWSFLLRVGLD